MNVLELKKAMNTLKKVSTKNSLSVINNVLFQNGKIIASNLEQFILFDTDIQNNFLIDSNTLHKIASKIKKGDITFEVEERIHLLIDGVKKFSFNNDLDIYDFPKIPENINTNLEVSQEIYKIMHRANKYVAKDELRPVMNGVLISDCIVATDAHKMIFVPNPNQPDADILVPSLTFSLMDVKNKLKSFNYNDKYCSFKFEGCEIITSQIDGKFPSYQSVIPTTFNGSLHVEKDNILENIDLALIVANSYSNKIVIQANDYIKLMAEDIDFGEKFESELKGIVSGDEIMIGFNGEFLKQCLSELDNDIEIKYVDSDRAVVLNGEVLLMPMLVN